ncbi:MAG: response regulator [Armatimonadetes bacterium]|nr:response regulator [Armatimonadota bacterium]
MSAPAGDVSEPCHVVVAEDSLVQAKKLARLLTTHGFQVTTAENGRRALEAARLERPCVVISDIIMPEMNGYELCAAIKADPELRDIPVLLLTSLSDPHDIIDGLQAGADNFITKPYEDDYLLSRIRYLLANRSLRAAGSSEVLLEIVFQGQRYTINSERYQILDLLLSVFEAAVQRNEELQRAQEELRALNAGLEQRVQERTAELRDEVAERRAAEARVLHLNQVLLAVRNVNQLITQEKDRGQLLQRACDSLVETRGLGWAWVVALDAEGAVAEWRGAGLGAGFAPIEAELGRGELPDCCRQALGATGPVVVQSCPCDDMAAHDGEPARRLATVVTALRHAERTYGVLVTAFPEELQPTEEEIDLFQEVAGDLGYALHGIEQERARRQAEEQRAHLEAQLRQQQKLESIGTLAGGVAHEINNPIMGVMNYAELILDDVPLDSPLAQHAGEILRETERIATIVRNLLQFARHEKQSHSPARMEDIVEGTLSLVRAILRHDQIELEVEIPAELPALRCRTQQIQQVLMNLLTNARDALNEKYPGYNENKRITVTCRGLEQDGETWLRLTVEDHGTGIPEAVAERMLDPFFTTKDRDKGTGLGLAVSHGIVTDHRGKLWYETEQGEWTRFHVDLPTNHGWSQ